jgi:hypothetical protein
MDDFQQDSLPSPAFEHHYHPPDALAPPPASSEATLHGHEDEASFRFEGLMGELNQQFAAAPPPPPWDEESAVPPPPPPPPPPKGTVVTSSPPPKGTQRRGTQAIINDNLALTKASSPHRYNSPQLLQTSASASPEQFGRRNSSYVRAVGAASDTSTKLQAIAAAAARHKQADADRATAQKNDRQRGAAQAKRRCSHLLVSTGTHDAHGRLTNNEQWARGRAKAWAHRDSPRGDERRLASAIQVGGGGWWRRRRTPIGWWQSIAGQVHLMASGGHVHHHCVAPPVLARPPARSLSVGAVSAGPCLRALRIRRAPPPPRPVSTAVVRGSDGGAACTFTFPTAPLPAPPSMRVIALGTRTPR